MNAWILEAGTITERDIKSPEVHNYRLRLRPDDFLDVRVEQDDVDVRVVLLNGDAPLRAVDTATGKRGPERLWWVASEHQTELRIEVLATSGSGRYCISIEPPRPVGESDLLHVKAQGAYLRGQHHAGRGENDEAMVAYTEAARLWHVVGQPLQESLNLSELGILATRRNQLSDAGAYFRQALDIVRRLAETDQEVRLLNLSGWVHRLSGDLGQAARVYGTALELARSTGHRDGEAVAVNNSAVLYFLRGDTEKALKLFERARVLFRENGDEKNEAAVLRNLSRCFLLLDRLPDALDVLYQLLALPSTAKSPKERAKTLSAIGWFHHQQGDSQKALKFYENALQARETASPDGWTAGALDRMGTAYAALERWQEAQVAYRQALSLFKKGGYRLAEGHTLANLCRLQFLSGHWESGLELCRQALGILSNAGDLNAEAYVLYLMARLERRLGDLGSAQARMAETLDKVDHLRSVAGSETLETSFFADRQRFYEFYIDLLMELDQQQPKDGWDARALEVHERGRARSLLDLLAEARAEIRRNTAPALLEEERWLLARIEEKELERRMLESAGTSSRLSAGDRELRRLLRRHSDLRLEIRRASPKYASQVRPQPIGVAEIQRLLDRETLLLVYALGEERSFVWCVGPSKLVSYPLPPREDIEQRARAFYDGLSNPRHQVSAKGQTSRIAQWLSDTLLGPIATELEDSRLVVLGDGMLHYIPFGALPLPAGTATDLRPLVADHEILTLPSASALSALRLELENRPMAPGLIAIVADPVFDVRDSRVQRSDSPLAAVSEEGPYFDRLPYAAREARAILALTPAEPTLLIEGFGANRESVMSRDLGNYRILHFATHGVLDTTFPELSGLMLSRIDERGHPRRGFLGFPEIYNLDLPAELVVLSACKTAQGPRIRGEGLVGLTRAFFYAGVPRVMVSLWNVDDEATAELMTRFYKNLFAEGFEPAAALRAAQVSMLREKNWHPYHWAGFVLQGEWRGFGGSTEKKPHPI